MTSKGSPEASGHWNVLFLDLSSGYRGVQFVKIQGIIHL